MFIKGNKLILKEIRSILLIQLGDIGDVVLSFPAISALRENFPRANLVVAVREKAAELIEDCPWVDNVISIRKDKRKWYQELVYQKDFFLRLWKYNFDLAVDLRADSRGAIMTLLSGATQRIGFYALDGKLWRNRVFTHLPYIVGQPGQHMASYYLSILSACGLKTENIWPEITVPQEKFQKAAALLEKENIPLKRPAIAVQPFSLWPYKEWGTDKYAALIHRIVSEYDLPVIITGSTAEIERADAIVSMSRGNVYNFAGKTSIGMFAAVLKACGLFIGGDSAGIHIAAAVGTPSVGIFGPASADAWAPRGRKHCVIHKRLSCVPCNLKGCDGAGSSRCLEELTVDEVLPAVKNQIEFFFMVDNF